jgi:hypothetical protein
MPAGIRTRQRMAVEVVAQQAAFKNIKQSIKKIKYIYIKNIYIAAELF